MWTCGVFLDTSVFSTIFCNITATEGLQEVRFLKFITDRVWQCDSLALNKTFLIYSSLWRSFLPSSVGLNQKCFSLFSLCQPVFLWNNIVCEGFFKGRASIWSKNKIKTQADWVQFSLNQTNTRYQGWSAPPPLQSPELGKFYVSCFYNS